MVDRRERWNIQNGKRKSPQSKRHIRGQGQGLGRCFKRAARRYLGIYDRPAKNSWRSGTGEKARPNLSLEFRFDLEPDEGCRPRSGARFSPKEIKVAPDRDAASKRDVKRLEARIGRLHASLILAVLNPCVVHLQLPLGRYDIVGSETFVK